QQSEVAAVQLDPKAFALQVLQPAGTQVAPPVTLHPSADGGLTQVATRLLTLNPFVSQRFLLALGIDAGFFHRLLLCTHPLHLVCPPSYSSRCQQTLHLILTFSILSGKLRPARRADWAVHAG